MCCIAIQETRIPSEMCAEETCITEGPTISRNGTEQIGTLFHGTERNR